MNEMNEQSSTSRKIIVAGAMVVVVGIGTVTFALRSHRPSAVAQIPAVPATVPQTPDASSSGVQTPDVPGAVPQTPDVAVSDAQRDRLSFATGNTAVPAAGDTKSTGDRRVASAHTGVGTNNHTVTRTSSAVDSSEKPAAATVANSVDGGTSAVVPTMPSAPGGMAANAPDVAMSTEPTGSSTDPVASSSAAVASSAEPAASDIRITTAVKSEIAADSSSKDSNVGVSTTNGVVVLTGTLATQDAIDHVKSVAENVKDVKSVDTSALRITST
jgi:hyperosmotically inducible periplasmic protein